MSFIFRLQLAQVEQGVGIVKLPYVTDRKEW